MKEIDRLHLLQAAATDINWVLLRNDNKLAYVGKVIEKRKDHSLLVLANWRYVHAGLGEGTSDLIGISDTGLFVAAEEKSENDGPTGAQTDFINMVNRRGGIAGVVRSVEDLRGLASGRHGKVIK